MNKHPMTKEEKAAMAERLESALKIVQQRKDDPNVLYKTPPMKIGSQSYWRLIVIPSSYAPGRATLYQWISATATYWHDQQDWPSYDFNDTYLGLPMALRTLFDKHKSEIANVLAGEPASTGMLELVSSDQEVA